MTTTIFEYLRDHGPSRSAAIVEALQKAGLSAEAARQRVSRARPPVQRFPIPLLPKREAFLYLQKDRNSERFWDGFLRDLRAAGSVYAAAVDGLAARGGVVTADQFAVISGAPAVPQKGQVAADLVLRRLTKAGFVRAFNDVDLGPCVSLAAGLASTDGRSVRARAVAEAVLLDGMREWMRKIGLASYNSILVRGDPVLRPIGPFTFDLAGPSYLLPLQAPGAKPGFVVADVFAEGTLDADHIQYFVRKARMLKATLAGTGVFAIIVAEGFTGAALSAGHAAGLVMATPKDLFGRRVGTAIASLVETLKNAAAYAASSPGRITALIDNLLDIEGRAGNLRGVLFELVAGYLARRDAPSIDMGVKATDPATGRKADIDVQKVTHQASSVTAIECKGKSPGGVLERAEVERWLEKITVIRGYYRAHPSFRESEVRFELWTSGTIHPDALALLADEKARRTKAKIDWKDGDAVLALARAGKEKAISDALEQHFVKHPLADAARQLAVEPPAPAVAPLGDVLAPPPKRWVPGAAPPWGPRADPGVAELPPPANAQPSVREVTFADFVDEP